MQIWQSLILFSSLLISNLVIYKKILSFESSKKILSSIAFAAFLFPLLYGAFYFLSSYASENFKVIAYGVFFINNAWFLIFLRNSIIGYNQKLNIGKYFLWTIIGLLIPISLILFYNPVEDFTDIIFNSAYLIGIFPMTIFVSILLGISVNSLFWGVFASVAFFSLDFAIRTGLIMVIPADYQIVISELFRVGFITLFSLVSLFGTQIKKETPSEIIKGTKKLNNLLFMLLTVFPVMIFYTAFWQVNINHKKLQENEINVSQEIFMLSIEKLSDYSDKYTRIVSDLLNSPSIASAQWKIESYKFSNPEIHSGQIITYKSSPFEGPSVLTNNGMIEFTSDSQKGWAIKLIVDSRKIYEELPLKVEHRFYLFDDQTPVLSPPNFQLQRSDLVFSNKYQYAFESQKKLFEKNMEIIMIFQTPPPELSGFTIYFLFFSVLILVLIWAFYGYYMNNWEKNAKEYLDEVKQESLDYRKKLETIKNSMVYMSKDISKKELSSEEIYKRYAYIFNFINDNNFHQKSDIALSFFFKGIKSRIKFFEELYLIKKSLSENFIFATSDGSKKNEKIQIEKNTPGNEYTIVSNTSTLQCVGTEDNELLLCIQKSETSQIILKEREYLEDLLEVCKFYLKQHRILTRNEGIFEKTFRLLKMFEKVKVHKYMTEEWFISLLGEMKFILNDPTFLSFYTYNEEDINFYYLNKNQLTKKNIPIDETTLFLKELKRDSYFFEHISPDESISGYSRSFAIIPFYFKNKKTGLYFEYSDYRVFSQREIELYFFIAKSLSERGEEYQ